MDKTKDVTLGERRFRLKRLSAAEGNQVVRHFLLLGILPKVTGDDDKGVAETDVALFASATLAQMDDATFAGVQRRCFAACEEYVKRADADIPTPLFRPDGKWEVDELDAPTSLGLLSASLGFNLAPFFAPGALKMLKAVYSAPNPSSAPMASTGISGVPS